jgi:hypothetical protein
MSVPARLQLLLESLGEKVKRASDLEPRDPALLTASSPSRVVSEVVIYLSKSPPEPLRAVNSSSAPLKPNLDKLPAPQRVVTSQSLAEELTVHLKAELCKKSLHIYRGLVCLAIEVAKGRGVQPKRHSSHLLCSQRGGCL